jgi:hypothetical protein
MKVFISWSGNRSKAVAEVLSEWIKCALQAARPWISAQNIDRGALWFNEIQTQLQNTSVGIVCLTQDNKVKPWILFESGALAKGLSASRVCTFLVDLSPADIENPLAQFNHTLPNSDSMWELLRTLNACLSAEQTLPENVLEKVFDTYWPQFERDFADALEKTPAAPPTPPRSDTDLLTEILEHTRSLSARVNEVERKLTDPISTLSNLATPRSRRETLEKIMSKEEHFARHGLLASFQQDAVENAVGARSNLSSADRDEMIKLMRRKTKP